MKDEAPPFLVQKADGVLTLSFNRPEQGNSIPQVAVPGLTALFSSIATDSTIHVLKVRGVGPNFATGGDVQNFARALEQSIEARRDDFRARLEAANSMVEAYMAIPVPIVA